MKRRALSLIALPWLCFGIATGCGNDDSDDSSSSGATGNTNSVGSGGTTAGTANSGTSSGGTAQASGGTAASQAGQSAKGGTGSGVPGTCLPENIACDAPGATCCAGTECVRATPNPICLVPCKVAADCTSGCCVQYGNISSKVCADASECASCTQLGEPCAGKLCCEGSICTNAEGPTQTCVKECKQPSDCSSNCCAKLGNDERSVCMDPRFCSEG